MALWSLILGGVNAQDFTELVLLRRSIIEALGSLVRKEHSALGIFEMHLGAGTPLSLVWQNRTHLRPCKFCIFAELITLRRSSVEALWFLIRQNSIAFGISEVC